jgi:hypothetical protein
MFEREAEGRPMVRRYDEVIEVRETSTSGPAVFLWRGRIYAVRSVLGHWRERRAWWLEGATARLLGLDATTPEPVDEFVNEPVDEPVTDVLEREIWRVEAGAGRSDTLGVYDLSRDVAQPEAHWRLLQVAD